MPMVKLQRIVGGAVWINTDFIVSAEVIKPAGKTPYTLIDMAPGCQLEKPLRVYEAPEEWGVK